MTATTTTAASPSTADFWDRAAVRFPLLGILLAFLCAVFSTGATLTVKFVPQIHPISIILIRGVVQCLVYIGPVLYKKIPIMGNGRQDCLWLTARGVIGFAAFLLMFLTVSLIPYSDGVTLIQSAPVYTAIFAAFMLGERCGPLQILTIMATLVGVVLIARPEFLFDRAAEPVMAESTRVAGVACGIGAALVLGGTFVIVRKLRDMPSDLVLLWFSLVSMVLGGILYETCIWFDLVPGLRMPNTMYEIGVCTLTAFCCVMQQSLLVYSLKIEEANVFALVKSSEIILGFACQALFLTNEPIETSSVLGALIIFSAVMVSILRRFSKESKNRLDWLRRLVSSHTGSTESIATINGLTSSTDTCTTHVNVHRKCSKLFVDSVNSCSIAVIEAASQKRSATGPQHVRPSLGNVLITVDPLDFKCPSCKTSVEVTGNDKL